MAGIKKSQRRVSNKGSINGSLTSLSLKSNHQQILKAVELIETSLQLQAILDHLTDAITLIKPGGGIIFANQAAAKNVGIKTEELVRMSPLEIYQKLEITNERGQPLSIQDLPATKVLRHKKYNEELLGIRLKGSDQVRWMLSKASPVFDTKGQLQSAVIIYEEITDRIVREQHREIFLGGLSHELKNLLASTKAYILILRKRLMLTNQHESLDYAAKIDEKTSRLSHMIIDFMEMVRIRSGELKLQKNRLKLGSLLEQVVSDMQNTNFGININLKITSNPSVLIDQDKFKQVIINLIDNAIKYSPGKKSIKVELKQLKTKTCVAIQDQGIGIAKKDMPRLFDPFYRANIEKRSKSGGIGLGLYISAEIIKSHGGEIIVKSQKNKGSTFTILLPRHKLT